MKRANLVLDQIFLEDHHLHEPRQTLSVTDQQIFTEP